MLGLLKAQDEPTLSLLQMLDLEPEVLQTRIENRIFPRDFQGEDRPNLSSATQKVLETVFHQKADAVDTGLLLRVLAKTCRELQKALAPDMVLAKTYRELQQVLARDMQMGLMPKTSPNIEGFDIAGRCISAGEYYRCGLFKFLEQNGKLMLMVADVPSRGMAAGVPVVMFDGILESQMKISAGMGDLLRSLNVLFFSTLEDYSSISFTMGELNPATHVFRVVNGGRLCPYHYRAETGGFVELQVDARPLGIRPDTAYEAKEIQLESGDRMVFC